MCPQEEETAPTLELQAPGTTVQQQLTLVEHETCSPQPQDAATRGGGTEHCYASDYEGLSDDDNPFPFRPKIHREVLKDASGTTFLPDAYEDRHDLKHAELYAGHYGGTFYSSHETLQEQEQSYDYHHHGGHSGSSYQHQPYPASFSWTAEDTYYADGSSGYPPQVAAPYPYPTDYPCSCPDCMQAAYGWPYSEPLPHDVSQSASVEKVTVMCCYHKQGGLCKMGADCWYSHDGGETTPCHYGAKCKAGHAHLVKHGNGPARPLPKRGSKRSSPPAVIDRRESEPCDLPCPFCGTSGSVFTQSYPRFVNNERFFAVRGHCRMCLRTFSM